MPTDGTPDNVLFEWYGRYIGDPETETDVYLGFGLFFGGIALGVGALSNVLSSFSWPSLPEFTWPDLPDIEPPGPPGWTPIGVEEPSEVPVEPNPDPVSIEEPQPSEYPVADPDPSEYPVAEPDPSEYPVEEPSPIPEPDWLPIEIGMPELSTSGAADDVGGGLGAGTLIAGGVGAALGIEGVRQLAIRGGSSASPGAGVTFPTPEAVGAVDPGQINRRRQQFNKQTPGFVNLPKIPEDKYSGSVFTAEGRQAQADGIRELISAVKDLRDDIRSTQEDTSSTRRTDVNIETNISVDGATAREVERRAEEAKKQALREFNRRIQNGR